LYPALHKLEADGLLDIEVVKVENRLRKYYKLTEIGTKETKDKLEEMQQFLRTMQQLVSPKFSLE
ncbi:MAG: helix-turn-helix transcriptional regulator, partial [Polaribacter sp.]|nr:helix-turn-helix transcriptional regulator [Polaribacter sp.]